MPALWGSGMVLLEVPSAITVWICFSAAVEGSKLQMTDCRTSTSVRSFLAKFFVLFQRVSEGPALAEGEVTA